MTQFSPEMLSAFASLLWPVTVAIVLLILMPQIRRLLAKASEISVEGKGIKLVIRPSQAMRPVDSQPQPKLPDIQPGNLLPVDYLFLNHSSFLRDERQAEFQKRTGIKSTHYDLRVIVDSYYEGALDRIDRVEYLLHESYPNPIQVRTRKENKFLLKEVANGEYVLVAKIFLKDEPEPLVLERYITLWKEGPRMEETNSSSSS